MGGQGTLGGVAVAWGSATDVGLRRAVNEDALLASPPVFLVADGMGGHEAGDVASQLVIDEFAGLLGDGMRALDDVVIAIRAVNTAIYDAGQASTHLRSMGTTAVGLMMVENGNRPSWLLFNIGDSRAYRFASGELEQLSTDHSYVQELVDAGDISALDARTHPQRNVVTKALGVEEAVQPDLWMRSPTPGERFVLCSDGLSSEIDDHEIGAVLASGGTATEAAQQLVERALSAGGRDNVTVLVLDVLSVDTDLGMTADTAPRDEALDGTFDNDDELDDNDGAGAAVTPADDPGGAAANPVDVVPDDVISAIPEGEPLVAEVQDTPAPPEAAGAVQLIDKVPSDPTGVEDD